MTSTKQFVWCEDSFRPFQFCEERDGAGTLSKKLFSRGQQNNTSNYFYTKDNQATSADDVGPNLGQANALGSNKSIQVTNPETYFGSVRELTDNSGIVQAQYAFDPFGQTTKLSEVVPSDFQFHQYYQHSRSRLSVTRTRLYSASLGRFLNRDPVGERQGTNLFAYVENEPIRHWDQSGLGDFWWPPTPPPPYGPGPANPTRCYLNLLCCLTRVSKFGPPPPWDVAACYSDFVLCIGPYGMKGLGKSGPFPPLKLYGPSLMFFDLLPIEQQWRMLNGYREV